ncbi:MAG: guanylate kinase [Syntrophaceae bacterium]|nr:guanylate kinase [Syntrophaceae bacterium]
MSNAVKDQGLIFVVSAPSGTGKSTICRRLLAACPDLEFSVSHTSRPPRPGEADGRDYCFISRADFEERIALGEFVEWVENYGNLYGTSVKAIGAVLARGKDLLLDIEPRGARAIKERYPDAVFVFILPPSRDELLKRLEKRGHESAKVIQERFAQAERELREVLWYDYAVFNEDLEAAVLQTIAVYRAEKCKVSRLRGAIDLFF